MYTCTQYTHTHTHTHTHTPPRHDAGESEYTCTRVHNTHTHTHAPQAWHRWVWAHMSHTHRHTHTHTHTHTRARTCTHTQPTQHVHTQVHTWGGAKSEYGIRKSTNSVFLRIFIYLFEKLFVFGEKQDDVVYYDVTCFCFPVGPAQLRGMGENLNKASCCNTFFETVAASIDIWYILYISKFTGYFIMHFKKIYNFNAGRRVMNHSPWSSSKWT